MKILQRKQTTVPAQALEITIMLLAKTLPERQEITSSGQ